MHLEFKSLFLEQHLCNIKIMQNFIKPPHSTLVVVFLQFHKLKVGQASC
jgi:hypothetical protein